MNVFRFRLQRVRDLREAREKDKLTEFGREQRKLGLEAERLTMFRDEAEQQRDEMRAERSQPFAVWGQTASVRYLSRVDHVIEYQSARVAEQERTVEQSRLRFLDARRETDVLNRLREKHFDEWKRGALREEGKILDEIGSRKTSGDQI